MSEKIVLIALMFLFTAGQVVCGTALLKLKDFKPTYVRKITAQLSGDKKTWVLEYPQEVQENTNYIFLVDFPKGQDNAK